MKVFFCLGQGAQADEDKLIVARVDIRKKHLKLLPIFGLQLENNVLTHAQYGGMFPAWAMALRAKKTQMSLRSPAACSNLAIPT